MKTSERITVDHKYRVTSASVSPDQIDPLSNSGQTIQTTATVEDAAGNTWTHDIPVRLVRADGTVVHNFGEISPNNDGVVSPEVNAGNLDHVSAGTVAVHVGAIHTDAVTEIQWPARVMSASLSPSEVDLRTEPDEQIAVRGSVEAIAGDPWTRDIPVTLVTDNGTVVYEFSPIPVDSSGAFSETIRADQLSTTSPGDISLRVAGMSTDALLRLYHSPNNIDFPSLSPGTIDLSTTGEIAASAYATDSRDSVWSTPVSMELVASDGDILHDFGADSPDRRGLVSEKAIYGELDEVSANSATLHIGGRETDASVPIRSVDRVTTASVSPGAIDFGGSAGNVDISARVLDGDGDPWTDGVSVELVRADGTVAYEFGELEPNSNGDIAKRVSAEKLRGVSAGTVELEVAGIKTGAMVEIIQAPETIAFASLSPGEVDKNTDGNTDIMMSATVLDGADKRWTSDVSARLLGDSDGTVVHDFGVVPVDDTGALSETVQVGNIDNYESGTVRLEVAGIETHETITLTDSSSSSQQGAPEGSGDSGSCTVQLLGVCL
jgi:hypothetical protein